MRGLAVSVALALVSVLCSGGCQDGYPVEATPCDRLCYALEPSGCAEGPAECVLGCEHSPYSEPRCQTALLQMTRCLERTPDSDLGCSIESTSACNAQLVDLYLCRGDLSP